MTDVLTYPEADSDSRVGFVAGQNEYAKLGELSVEGAEKQPASPDREALNDRAAEIMASINYATHKPTNPMTYQEAYTATREAYVVDEENPALEKFGRMVLLAPMVARAQGQLETLEPGTPANDAEIRKLKRISCEYNNLVGEIVEEQLTGAADESARVTPEDLQSWLEKASGGNVVYAEKIALGTQAEIAAMPLLTEVGVQGLARAGVEADLMGKDIVFDRTARGYDGVDVKTGSQRPKLPVSRDEQRGKLLLSINPNHMKGFRVKDEYADAYIEELQTHLL